MTLRDPEYRAALMIVRARRREAKREHKAKTPPKKTSRGRERDPGFLAYTRRLPCCVGPVDCVGATQAAHIRYSRPGTPNPGLGVKPSDRFCVPLCRGHHLDNPDAQHRGNERAFWESKGLDPFAIAAANYDRYLKEP